MKRIGLLCGMTSVLLSAGVGVAQDSIWFSPPILVDSGSSPQWSPDGSMLAYLSRGGLFVVDTPDFKNPRRIGDAPHALYQWVGDSGFAWVERPQPKHDSLQWNVAKLYYMDLSGHVELVEADSVNYRQRDLPRIGSLLPSRDGTFGYRQVSGADPFKGKPKVIRRYGDLNRVTDGQRIRRFAYTERPAGRLGPFGHIWISDPDGSMARQVTAGPELWMFPVLAPNESLVAASNSRGEIVILDTAGTVLANAGRGTFPSWSPDCRLLAISLDEETEFDVIGSELFVFDLTLAHRYQATSTTDVIEGKAMWSPTSEFIAYPAENTAQIFLVRVGRRK